MIETSNGLSYQKLSPEEMQQRRILGRLVGPCADFIDPTRNGRKYSQELWEKVFENPIMKEKLANKVCYGELGHPADREEVDMEKAAICLAEPPKKDKSGILNAVFDILDTPNGRILKALCDYGSKLGISSRGTGEVIEDFEGNESVDPNTYECECWDVVIIPAVEKARLTYVTESLSSKNKKGLKAVLTEELNKATKEERKVMEETLNELDINLEDKDNNLQERFFVHADPESKMKAIQACVEAIGAESVIEFLINEDGINLRTIESMVNYCQIKEGDFGIYQYEPDYDLNESGYDSEKRNNINEETSKEDSDNTEEAKNNGSEELIKSLQEALKEKALLEEQVQELQNKIAVSDTKVNELNEGLAKHKAAVARLSTLASNNKTLTEQVSHLEGKVKVQKQTIEKKDALIENLKDINNKLTSEKTSLNESITKGNTDVKSLKEQMLKEKKENTEKINQLNEQLENLKADSELKYKELTKKLNHKSELVEKYKKAINSTISRYIESKARMLGVSANKIKSELNDSYTIDDIDRVCESLQEDIVSISRLPFNITSKTKGRVVESKNDNLNPNNGIDDDVDDSLVRMANLR